MHQATDPYINIGSIIPWHACQLNQEQYPLLNVLSFQIQKQHLNLKKNILACNQRVLN